MFNTRFSVLRFSLTFGLLFLLLLVVFTVAYPPLKHHVDETQQRTSLLAKSQILSYQTPDFNKLAQNILNDHVFKPKELDTYEGGTHYLSFYQKGSELFPELFEMHYMEGICHFWMGDMPAAESSLRQSLQINPIFFWTYYNLGLLYLKNGQFDVAIALLSRAKLIPVQLTAKLLHDQEAFEIIWRFMPDPQGYITRHIQKVDQQINYLLLVALAFRDHHGADVHFDPEQWNPVFF